MELTSKLKKELDNSWFRFNEEDHGDLIYTSREYGCVGSETAGVEDMEEAKRLVELAISEGFSASWSVVDEWVDVYISK